MKLAFFLLAVEAFAQSAPALQSPILGQSVSLTWADSMNPTGTTYNIYQALGACPAVIPAPPIYAGIANTSAVLSGLGPGTFCWGITAVSPAGGESTQSNLVSYTILPGKYDDLGAGSGIVKTAAPPISFSIDNTIVPITGAGTIVPTRCGGANQFFFQTYLHPDGSLSTFRILVCDPKTMTLKNLPFYKQGT